MMKKTYFFCLQKYMESIFLVITKRTFFWTIRTLTSMNYDTTGILIRKSQHIQCVIKQIMKMLFCVRESVL